MAFDLEKLGKRANPGDLLVEESYRGQDDHPDYIEYVRRGENETTWFVRPNIPDGWSGKPLISEGFDCCYPIIAVKPSLTQAQGVHVSPDEWFPTNMMALRQKTLEWQAEKDRLIIVRKDDSYLSQEEVDKISTQFPERFLDIPLGVDSRFGVISDLEKRILLVQLTDKKLLRVYKSF